MNIQFKVIPREGKPAETISASLAAELDKHSLDPDFLFALWVELDGFKQPSDHFKPILDFCLKMER